MPSKNQNADLIDAFSRSLEDPSFTLQPAMQARMDRLKAVYTRWAGNPLITDTQMRDFITTQFGIGKIQAYNDIALVKVIFGSVPKADKEFQRMKVNKLLDQATAAAIAGDSKQAKALTKIAETLTKANQLDEPEGEDYPWDDIIPRDESFSVDPSVIGITKVPGIEEKARKLLKQYTQDLDIDEQ